MLAKRSQLPFLKTILQETDYASPPVLEFDFVDALLWYCGRDRLPLLMAFELTEGGHLKRKRFLRFKLSIRGLSIPAPGRGEALRPLNPLQW